MDFLPIAFLVLFVLVGGLVALGADEVGRRIGKRRLKLHRNIRPKTTARILTFLWGVMITVLTMLLIGFSSSDMRTLLLRGRLAIQDLQSQRDHMQQDVSRLQQQVAELEQSGRDMALKIKDSESKLKNADMKQAEAEKAATAAQAAATAFQSKAKDAEARYAAVQPRLASIQTKYEQAQSKIATANRQLADRQKALAVAKGKYDYVYKNYTELQKQQLELTVKNGELAKQIAEADKELQAKNSTIRGLNDQISDLEKQKQDAEMQRDAAKDQLDLLLDQVRKIQGMARTGATTMRFSNILFTSGQELARVDVPAGTSKNQVLEKIESALILARQRAKAGGAQVFNGIEYADLLPLPDDHGNTVTIETQKDMLAADVAGSSDNEVLIVYALMNAFAGESVPVSITHRKNPVVYQPNQVLAEVRVDGRQDLSKILATLNGLGDRIRNRAIQDKMIPGRDDSFGSFSSEDVLRLFSEIKQSGGSVRVQAVTRRETRAADPLVLDFKVR